MTSIEDVRLEQVIVHRVGNPTRGEECTVSDSLLTIEEEITQRLLHKYFLGSFNENELYRFTHLSELDLNEVYTYVRRIFDDKNTFISTSQDLARFLHSKFPPTRK